MTLDEYSELHCPLLVIRKHPDADGEYVTEIEPCAEPLYTSIQERRYYLAGGEVDSCGPTWGVECGVGHVLLVPDHEADDNFYQIPFDEEMVKKALSIMGVKWS